jgi:hypothetical protein
VKPRKECGRIASRTKAWKVDTNSSRAILLLFLAHKAGCPITPEEVRILPVDGPAQ